MFNTALNNNAPEKTGTVKAWGGSTAPSGWLFCDGAAISRTTYAALFAVIGTTYGSGDGTTTFNLPNGKIPIGITTPVIGNGLTLGLTNGTDSVGLAGVYAGSRQALGGKTAAFGVSVGTGAQSDDGNTRNFWLVGVTTTPEKSGIVADLTRATAATNAIIKY